MKNYSKITPEGTRDLLFEECDAKRMVESALSKLFKSRGYKKVITPTVEFFDVFNRDSAGMPPETLYSLTDNSGRLLVLRPDNTLPIARIATTRLRDADYPLRLYYNQSVFRRCPSYTGHSDETTQGGIELIGASGLRADMEILLTAVEALNFCGAPDYRIEIGHAGFFKALSAELETSEEIRCQIGELIETKSFAALNDLLEEVGDNETTRAIKNLPRLFGGAEVLDEATKLCNSAQAKQALDYLKEIFSRIESLGLGNKINIDMGLVHRSNYYTGMVFRGYIEGSGVTILSGGRYDRLIGEFGKELPATGFGIETDELAKALLLNGAVEAQKPADALVFGENGCEALAVVHAGKLNEKGLICEISTHDNLQQAKEYAAQKGIKRLEIVGMNDTCSKKL
ncbi:MAG TPA: ATP phosphoribosyltransferase regulatory subunit [Clostridia bacterium]|nr:ATP phosphoribosyltransferase regulatory subunit [Clostridia bacterium]